MAGLGKLMNFLKLTDEDDEFEDDYYNDDYAYDQREIEKEEKRLLKEQRREEKRAAFRDKQDYRVKQEKDDYYDEPAVPPTPVQKKSNTFQASAGGKVVQMPSSSGEIEDIRIVRPSNIEEAQQVCTLLMETHPVVVNLEGIDVQEAQRIMDFVSGCVYAVSGNMCQVSRYIFVFAPKDIDIYGDYLKSLENDEIYNIASFSKEF